MAWSSTRAARFAWLLWLMAVAGRGAAVMVSAEAGVAQRGTGLTASDPSTARGISDAPVFWHSRGVLDAPTLEAFEAEDAPRRSPGENPATGEGWDLEPEGEPALMALSGQAEAVGKGSLWFEERELTMRMGEGELPGTWDEPSSETAGVGPAADAAAAEPQEAGTGGALAKGATAVRRAGGFRNVPVWCIVLIAAAGLLFLVGLRALRSVDREEF